MSSKKSSHPGVPHYLKIAPMARTGSNGVALTLSYPRVEAPSLEGIEVSVKLESAPDEEELVVRYNAVKRAVLAFRLRNAGEAMALGDEVQIDTFASVGDQIVPFSFKVGLWVALKPGLMMTPGLAENLAAQKVGQRLAFGFQVPAEYPAVALRGRQMTVMVSVLAAKQLTDLADDSPELLARLKRGKTLEEVMASIREELIDEKAEVGLLEGRMRVIGELIERTKIELKPEHIDAEIDASWRRIEGNLMRERGFDAAALESARQGWLKDPTVRVDAEWRTKASLVVGAIRERDEINVTPERLKQVLGSAVPGLTEADAFEALTQSDEVGREMLRLGIYLATVEHIMSKAKVQYVGG